MKAGAPGAAQIARRAVLQAVLGGMGGLGATRTARAQPGAAPNGFVLSMQDGLLTATFVDGTDDAALLQALPALALRNVQAISLRGAPVRDLRALTALKPSSCWIFVARRCGTRPRWSG